METRYIPFHSLDEKEKKDLLKNAKEKEKEKEKGKERATSCSLTHSEKSPQSITATPTTATQSTTRSAVLPQFLREDSKVFIPLLVYPFSHDMSFDGLCCLMQLQTMHRRATVEAHHSSALSHHEKAASKNLESCEVRTSHKVEKAQKNMTDTLNQMKETFETTRNDGIKQWERQKENLDKEVNVYFAVSLLIAVAMSANRWRDYMYLRMDRLSLFGVNLSIRMC